MRIAVIGGAGFVGAHLVTALLEQGHEVMVYDNFCRRRPEQLTWLGRVRLVAAEILDRRRLQEQLSAFRPALIYHLAALHYIPYCDQHPGEAMRVNVEGTLNVMLAAAACGACAVLFASSVAVYAPTDRHHLETDQPRPSDIYGLTKHLAEQVVEQYARQSRISHLALRFSNLYGPEETNTHVIPAILGQLLHGADTLSLGRTDPCRDFLYMEDLIDALLAMVPLVLREEMHEILNLGPGREWTVQKAVDILCELSGRNVRVMREEGRVRPVDRLHLRANIGRARELLAWEPKHDLRSGLEKTYARESHKQTRRFMAAQG